MKGRTTSSNETVSLLLLWFLDKIGELHKGQQHHIERPALNLGNIDIFICVNSV